MIFDICKIVYNHFVVRGKIKNKNVAQEKRRKTTKLDVFSPVL